MTTQTMTTFVGIVGRDENLFRETKSDGSAGGNQAILRSFPQIFGKIFICSTDTSKKKSLALQSGFNPLTTGSRLPVVVSLHLDTTTQVHISPLQTCWKHNASFHTTDVKGAATFLAVPAQGNLGRLRSRQRKAAPASYTYSPHFHLWKSWLLKGQSNEILDLLFSSFEPALATDQWIKIFSILVKNSQSYSNFKSENLTPRGIILRRVRLHVVWYPGKTISELPFFTLNF